MVEGAAASRPSRQPISGMSSFARHSASSIAFHSRMGASTGGIALGSPHDSDRLHTSVWEKSPPLRRGSTDSSKQRLQGFCSTARAFPEEIPQSDIEQGFFSRYFLARKRDGGLRPILDLRRLNFSETPISANPFSGSSFGFHSDAGLIGSCQDIQFYSMSGPLQARPSCLCRFMPQAARPHGSGIPYVAPRVASHEAVPLVDEGAEVTPHCTSHSPSQGVAQLLSTPFTMAGPRFSSEQGKNRCDSPSPYGHNGRINDGLGSGLQRQTGERRMDRRVPLLAHKLPGTQGCLPGFDVFSPLPPEASYHSQDGQHGRCVPHKASRRFTVAHPGQDCVLSSPLVPVQVPVLEGSSRSGNTEPRGRLSVETETQDGGMDVEPSDGIPDLGSVWRSGGGPLCFSRVIPVPTLVLPEFPDDSGHRCVHPSMAECQSVRVSANKADSGSTMQSEGERCPSPSHR